jgi:hypothetical protein
MRISCGQAVAVVADPAAAQGTSYCTGFTGVLLEWPIRNRNSCKYVAFPADAPIRSYKYVYLMLLSKPRTVQIEVVGKGMSRSSVVFVPLDVAFMPFQGDNNICVHTTKRPWISTFRTRKDMLSSVTPISGLEPE